jgi:hypothetical protein
VSASHVIFSENGAFVGKVPCAWPKWKFPINARLELLDETRDCNATTGYFRQALRALVKHLESTKEKCAQEGKFMPEEEAVLMRSQKEPNKYGSFNKNDIQRKKMMVIFITSALELCGSGSCEKHMARCAAGLIDFVFDHIFHHTHSNLKPKESKGLFDKLNSLLPEELQPDTELLRLLHQNDLKRFPRSVVWCKRYIIAEELTKDVFGLHAASHDVRTWVDGYLAQRYAMKRCIDHRIEDVEVVDENGNNLFDDRGKKIKEKKLVAFSPDFVTTKLHDVLKRHWLCDPFVTYGEYDDAHKWTTLPPRSKIELENFVTELYRDGYFEGKIGDLPWVDRLWKYA